MPLGLADDVSLRMYRDKQFAYDRRNHELYELDSASFSLLQELRDLSLEELRQEQITFLNECLDVRILSLTDTTSRVFQNIEFAIDDAPLYLLLHITERCNLTCGHCYLGPKSKTELTIAQIGRVIEEFQGLAGLTVLISGGEPLLHPDFWVINDLVDNSKLRFELLTNGTLIDGMSANRLRFHEVQISIDGWRSSHDALRGIGSFDRSMAAIESLLDVGHHVSIATMITRHNTNDIEEFHKLETFCFSHGITNWSVNAPCEKGDWVDNKEAAVAEAAKTVAIVARFGYGEGQHDLGLKHACGGNLCTVMADGSVVGCVLSTVNPFGSLEDGLAKSWHKRTPFLLKDTECATCEHLTLCRGGCRISALETTGSLQGKDLVQCSAIMYYYETIKARKGGGDL
ncbi:MAG TPA: radical SAM protein [candidate division Zixibacteria bacterium]|nr:radical SAM protein [candidate division Zixibacteria bacterium]